MKVVLVNPPVWNINSPPINIAYLKSYAQARGHEVKAFDFSIEVFNKVDDELKKYWLPEYMSLWTDRSLWDSQIKTRIQSLLDWMVNEIMKENPSLVGFTANYSPPLIIDLAKELRNINPRMKIIVGGEYAAKLYFANTFLQSGYIDLCVYGEGEQTFIEILNKINGKNDLFSIPGTIIIKNGEMIENPRRQRIIEIESIPFPDFSDFNLGLYYNWENSVKEARCPVLFSRGCVNHCDFCIQNSLWGKPFLMRSGDNVFEEVMLNIKKYKINYFQFSDLEINGDLKKLERFVDILTTNQIKIQWGGSAIIRSDMDTALLKKMKASGCSWLSFGLESASAAILKRMGRGYSSQIAQSVIKNVFDAGIVPTINLIVGYPEETMEDLEITLSFIKKCRDSLPDRPNASLCRVLPGTPLYDRMLLEGNVNSNYHLWSYKTNTFEERKRRVQYLNKEIMKLYDSKGIRMADEDVTNFKK